MQSNRPRHRVTHTPTQRVRIGISCALPRMRIRWVYWILAFENILFYNAYVLDMTATVTHYTLYTWHTYNTHRTHIGHTYDTTHMTHIGYTYDTHTYDTHIDTHTLAHTHMTHTHDTHYIHTHSTHTHDTNDTHTTLRLLYSGCVTSMLRCKNALYWSSLSPPLFCKFVTTTAK